MENEKRLIYANELMSDVYRSDEQQKTDVWHTSDIEYLVMAQPTVDAVEVVRCKDCKHYMYEEYCNLLYGMDRRNPGDFCSYGERKDNV